jgi:hypothetical protein
MRIANEGNEKFDSIWTSQNGINSKLSFKHIFFIHN